MNTEPTRREAEELPERCCALLWDESFLWGLMARRALKEAGLPFDLLRSEEVRRGALTRYRMVFVPGGWASNKLKALGDQGVEAIRHFVAGGGSYLGICGGAGMATENGLGLLPIRRKPGKERVPSFSGPIRLSCCAGHAMWQEIDDPLFFAWWPSGFHAEDPNIKVLARYEGVRPEAFSADINVADGESIGWRELEKRYGILLDPSRLRGEPAVLEGSFGRGRVILSLVHFDTPGDRNGAAVLRNLWSLLTSSSPSGSLQEAGPERERSVGGVPENILDPAEAIDAAISELIAMGARNFLWYWRNALLLQWRRGVRGLEYATLSAMSGEIRRGLHRLRASGAAEPALSEGIDPSHWEGELMKIRGQLIPFCEKARRLLIRERLYMTSAPLSPVECADEEIRRLRHDLFGSAMSHGGQFKRIVDAMDRLVYDLIQGK